MVVQLIRSIECGLIKKKRHHMFVLLNNTPLCVAVNLTLLTQPGFTNAEALKWGRRLHCLTDMQEEKMVTLSNISIIGRGSPTHNC